MVPRAFLEAVVIRLAVVARAFLVAVVVRLGSGGRTRQWLLEHSWWQWW